MAQPAIQSIPTQYEDELERAFPGATLSHILTVRSRDQLGAAIEVLQQLRASGASLLALHVACYEDAFDHRVTLAGLGAGQARDLAGRLACAPGIESARVEHQIRRPV